MSKLLFRLPRAHDDIIIIAAEEEEPVTVKIPKLAESLGCYNEENTWRLCLVLVVTS